MLQIREETKTLTDSDLQTELSCSADKNDIQNWRPPLCTE